MCRSKIYIRIILFKQLTIGQHSFQVLQSILIHLLGLNLTLYHQSATGGRHMFEGLFLTWDWNRIRVLCVLCKLLRSLNGSAFKILFVFNPQSFVKDIIVGVVLYICIHFKLTFRFLCGNSAMTKVRTLMINLNLCQS